MLGFKDSMLLKELPASPIGKQFHDFHFSLGDDTITKHCFYDVFGKCADLSWEMINAAQQELPPQELWRVHFDKRLWLLESPITSKNMGVRKFDSQSGEGWYATCSIETFHICHTLSALVMTSQGLSEMIDERNSMQVGPLIQETNSKFTGLLTLVKNHPEVLKISKCIYGWNDDGSARVPMI